MDIAVALWIAVPLAAVHLLVCRRRAILVFQIITDLMLLILPVRVLLSGAHLGPGFAGGEIWGAPVTVAGSPEQSDLPLQFAVWWEEVRRLAVELPAGTGLWLGGSGAADAAGVVERDGLLVFDGLERFEETLDRTRGIG